ncbi:MAG: hypothetical protein AAF822_05620 [Pseudomonadota bacterium]
MSGAIDHTGPRFYANLADYISGISRDVLEIERSISTSGIEHPARLSDATLVSLQKIDHVQQRLADLATLFAEVAQGHVEEVTIVRRLALAETRSLLGCETKDQSKRTGDVDFF